MNDLINSSISTGRNADKALRLSVVLRNLIESGDLQGRLPGERSLAEEYSVNVHTVRKATQILSQKGLITCKPRSGSYVSQKIVKRSGTISATLGGASGYLQSHILQGIQQAAQSLKTRVMLGGNLEGNDFPQTEAIKNVLRVDHSDGVVLWPSYDESSLCPAVEILTSQRIPFCCVFGVDTRKKQPFSYIASDDTLGGYLATQHLIETGRKNIGFLTPKLPASILPAAYLERRREGYMKALWENGQSVPPMITVPWNFETRLWEEQEEDELFKSIKGFDALFCALNDEVAVNVMRTLNTREVRIPDDMAIVGYNNSLISQGAGITSVEQHPVRIGVRAVTVLAGLLQDETSGPIQEIIKPELVIRASSLKSNQNKKEA